MYVCVCVFLHGQVLLKINITLLEFYKNASIKHMYKYVLICTWTAGSVVGLLEMSPRLLMQNMHMLICQRTVGICMLKLLAKIASCAVHVSIPFQNRRSEYQRAQHQLFIFSCLVFIHHYHLFFFLVLNSCCCFSFEFHYYVINIHLHMYF